MHDFFFVEHVDFIFAGDIDEVTGQGHMAVADQGDVRVFREEKVVIRGWNFFGFQIHYEFVQNSGRGERKLVLNIIIDL